MPGNYRVLVINGGGVRGIIPAMILKDFSDKSGKAIPELFDYIVGTSIGGIIATSLAVKGENSKLKHTTDNIVDIMVNEAQHIFPDDTIGNFPIIGPLHNFFYPKYSRDGIDNLLHEKLGNATFKDTAIPVTTVSYSLDKDSPRVWSTFKAEIKPEKYNYFLRDAAGATSAAPTYFPPKITKAPNGEVYHDIDGGIFSNSPTFLGIAELLEARPDISKDNLIVVNIGTGRFEDNSLLHDANSFQFSTISAAIVVVTTTIAWQLGGLRAAAVLAGVGTAFAWAGTLLKGYGQSGWITSHDLIGKMMKGAELSDTIEAASLFRSIKINPKLSADFADMDKGNVKHMQDFAQNIKMFIDSHDNILNYVVECLESRNFYGAACAHAREESSTTFKEEFQYNAISDLVDGFFLDQQEQ